MEEDMELSYFLDMQKSKGIPNGKLASEINVNKCTLSRIKNYEVCPSAKLAMKIEQKTEGKVKWWKLIQLCQENLKKTALRIEF